MSLRSLEVATTYEVKYEAITELDGKVEEFIYLLHALDVWEVDGGNIGMEMEDSELMEGIEILNSMLNGEDVSEDVEDVEDITQSCEPFGGVEGARDLLRKIYDTAVKNDGYIHLSIIE